MDLGKSHIVVMWTVGPDEVAAGDAVFQSHGKWMEGHSRQGDTALLVQSMKAGRSCQLSRASLQCSTTPAGDA